jgi:uncharacterized protein (DUF2249 family)
MNRKLVDLDVRDILRAKQEPFELIMKTVHSLGEGDILQLHTTFKPVPLLRVLGRQGFRHTVIQKEADHFVVQFYKEDVPMPLFYLDNRGLEPPEPMMRTLDMLENHSEFQQGEAGIEIWNDRVPIFLLPELDALGFDYEVVEEDKVVRVRIMKQSSNQKTTE